MSFIKSFSVGYGDMFYIFHGTDSFTIIDCCYSNEDYRKINFNEIKKIASLKGINRFISTHPDDDHIKGIKKFCEEIGIANFYVVKNDAIKLVETDDFRKYCELRDGSKAFYIHKGCSRKWLNQTNEERGGAGINFLWPDIENKFFKEELQKAKEGKAFNNISPVFTYSLKESIKVMWMGDMESEFLDKVKEYIDWSEVDVLFAPHHGRISGKVPTDVLKKLNPQIIVIGEAPKEDLYSYPGYNTILQNLAGDICFNCDEKVHVYVSEYSYNVDFLDNVGAFDKAFGHYIGSFKPKGEK